MVSSVNNSAQQSIINPFQQRPETNATNTNKKPEENSAQPRNAAAAGSLATQATSKDNSAEKTTALSATNNKPLATSRGSLLDVTV